MQKQTLERVVPALDRALGRVDDYLFDRSQSGNDDLGLTALRDLRRTNEEAACRVAQLQIAQQWGQALDQVSVLAPVATRSACSPWSSPDRSRT